MAHTDKLSRHNFAWLVPLLLAIQTTAVTDCAITMQRAYIPIQTFVKNKDQIITVTISTVSDAIMTSGTGCSILPPLISTLISGYQLDDPDLVWFENQMSSYTYSQGALVITIKTSRMAAFLFSNFAAYVTVSDAGDSTVKNSICFGIYRYEDETLNENILMTQSDICADIYCKIKFNAAVSAINSPALGESATVTLATTAGTITSTGIFCDHSWYVNSFAKYADGTLVGSEYVTEVQKTFTDPENGAVTGDFKYALGNSGKNEINDLQVIITPQTLSQKESVAVYVQVYDTASNLATGWKCFMVKKESSDISNFCVDYCGQYDQVFPYSALLTPNLGTYFVTLLTPVKANFVNYGYRAQQPMGCPLTHEITSTNANAESTAYILPINSLGVFYIKTTMNDANALLLSGQVPFVLTVKNQAGVIKATRNLQLTYAGCSSETIGYSESEPTNLNFYLDPVASIIQPKNTFYFGFTSSDTRCPLTFTKTVVSGADNAALDAILVLNFKNSLKEQNYYFNMTLSQSPLVPTTYIGKTFSFDLKATNQDGRHKTVRFNIKFLSCADLPNCQSCLYLQLVAAQYNSNVRWHTIGCTLCNVGYHGYLYDNSGLITRGCEVNALTNTDWSQANWGKLYIKNEDTSVVASQDCSSVYKNCQLCSGFGTCLKCDSGFNKSTFPQLAPVDLCIKDRCINCATTFANCQVYNQVLHKCLQCKPDFYFPDSNRLSCTARSATPQTQNIFVQSYSGTLHSDHQKLTATKLHKNDVDVGKTMDKPFFFLGELLSYLNSGMPGLLQTKIAQMHKSVTVHVYLGKGDHHLFFCPNQNLDDSDDACSHVDERGSWFSLFQYPTTDNIAVTYQPLFCSTKASWVGLNAAQTTWFDANCVAEATMPVVHVSKGFPMAAYFNITNSASFSNIKFSGLQQLQQPGLSTNKLFFSPEIYCSVSSTAEPDGSNKKLGVVSSNQNQLNCADVNFKGDILLAPSCLTITDSDDRPDKSQLYQDNYFLLDQSEQYYIDRVKTLFNLYGFSQMQSTSTKVPTLTITNCFFEYFFDYTALIFVETNQFSFESQSTFVKQALDRGFNIKMTGTTVRYSRFLKGTLFYKYDQIARTGGITLYKKNQKQMKFQYYEEQYLYPAVVLTDTQQLIVQNCNFTLLNYGRIEKSLAIASVPERVVAKHFTSFSPAVQFTTYYSNGVGIALNLQGFQGTIKMSNNVFSKNMIFFNPQITKNWKEITKQGLYMDKLRSPQYGRYMLQFCDQYMFNDVLTSYIDHPDSLLFQMEAQSTVLIAFSEKLAILDNNIFTDNIGFMGGAIIIDSPNLVANKAYMETYATPALRPNVILYQNTFERNMAYSSGNAVYMRSTELATNTNVCGLIHIELNTFRRNMAVTKSHNGGAITLACDFIDARDVERLASLSEFVGGTSKTTQLLIQDTITLTTYYKTYQYGSGIINNQFTENVSGQKGTAIYARGIDNLFIVQNSFLRNQPLYSFVESDFLSPLWKYYFLQTRLASWTVFSTTTTQVSVTNEFKYFQVKNADGEYIELPQVKGAVYIESCEVCFVTYISQDCEQCRAQTNSYNEVKNNTFIDNQSGVTFSEAQTMLKSSQIQIYGGNEHNIESNTLSNIGSIYYSSVQTNVMDYMNSLPPDYFKYQNAPLIRVTIPKLPQGKISFVNFRYNIFQNNTGYQSFTSKSMFRGFLIDFDGSETLNSNFVFESNQVRYCRVFGMQVSLFSLTGSVTVKNNKFYRIGSISSQDFNRTAAITALYKPASLDFSYVMSTQRGIFSINQPTLNGTLFQFPVYHKFIGNDFRNIFCLQACVYFMLSNDDVHPSVALFDGNTYRFILAKSQAISFTQASQSKKQQQISQYIYLVQIITNEIYENVQNELHYIDGGLNKVVQIFYNVQSINNFGLDPLITLQTTDAVFMQESVFTHKTPYQSRFAAIEASLLVSSQEADAALDFQFFETYYDATTKKWFIDILQNNGVMKIYNNQNLIRNDSDFAYLNYSLYNSETVYNYLRKQHGLKNISSNFHSNTFTGHQGKEVSLFDISNSVLSMNNSHFTSNTASPSNGFTFYVSESQFNGTNLVFGRNKGKMGGGIFFTGGSNNIQNSSFIQNQAYEQAGAIYVLNSNLVLNWTIFDSNTAVTDSAISVFGCNIKPVVVFNSIFTNNNAQQRLSSVTGSKVNFYNVTFTDNVAQMITSGFQIDDSQFIANNITVANTKTSSNSAVMSGFLFLSSASQVQILNSAFSNLYGSQAAVILAQGQSKLYVEKSNFTGNLVSQSNSEGQKGTIVVSQCISATIVGCNFTSNNNTNVNSDKSALVITGSKFYEKNSASDSYIQIFGQSLQVSNSEFQNSNSYLSKGSGIFGDSLPNFQITGCVFQQLKANQGGSIFLKSSNNGELISNYFRNNSATQGGGVYLQASNTQVRNNLFYQNSVTALPTQNKSKATSLSEGAGGAIYFSCVDQAGFETFFQSQDQAKNDMCQMILNGNVFSKNIASNKGGAVFVANKNLTLGKNSNTFLNNTAFYGNIFAYAPSTLNFSLPETPFLKQDPGIQLLFGRRLDEATSIFLQIVSGGLFSFNTTILDPLQQQYLDDSISTAQLLFNNSELGSPINGRQIANKGIYEFSDVEVRIKPDSFAVIILRVNSLSNYGNDIPFIESPIRFYIYARPCIAGEMYTQLLTCKECEFGTFLLVPQTEEGQCQPCFPNAICYGGNRVSPNQGYYRFDILTPVVEKCANFDACLGGSQLDLMGICALGYSGALCAQCSSGYYQRIDAFVCFQCFETWAEIIIWLFSLALCIGIVVWIQKQFIRNFSEASNTTLTIFKITVSHMQMIMILSKIGDFTAHSFIEIFLWAKITLLELYIRIIFPECLLQSLNSEILFYVEVAFMAVFPVLFFGASYFFWFVYSRVKKENKDLEKRFNRAVSNASLLMFIYYPFIIESLLTSVSCQDSQEENWDPEATEPSQIIQRLRVRPEIKCFQGTHAWFVWVVSVPSIMMWFIVFPILLLFKMSKNQNLIVKNYQPLREIRDDVNVQEDNDKIPEYSDKKKSEHHKQKTDVKSIGGAKSRYGFLFSDFKLVVPQDPLHKQLQSQSDESLKFFKPVQKILRTISNQGLEIQHPLLPKQKANSFYYWELLIYLRKTVLCLIVILGRSLDPQIHLNFLLVTLAVFSIIQFTARPYLEVQANRLELLSLIVGFCIVYIRMVMLSNNQEENIKQQTFNMFSEVQSDDFGKKLYQSTDGGTGFLSVISKILVVAATLLFDFFWLRSLRHELLVYLAQNKYDKTFKILTREDVSKYRDGKVGRVQEGVSDKDGSGSIQSSLVPDEKQVTQNSQTELALGDAQIKRGNWYQADEIGAELDVEIGKEQLANTHDSQRRLINDSVGTQVINPNQIGILGNQSHLISSARKGVHPTNLFRHQSDRSMNRPFYEDSQSHQQVIRELRSNKGKDEMGGISENYSQSNSINTNTIGARTMRLNGQSVLTNKLGEAQASKDNKSNHSQDIESHILSPARKRDTPIRLQKKYTQDFKKAGNTKNNKKQISASIERPIESSSGEFTWEDISTERKNDDLQRPTVIISKASAIINSEQDRAVESKLSNSESESLSSSSSNSSSQSEP